MRTVNDLTVRVWGAPAKYIRDMANNNGISLKDYAYGLIWKGMIAEGADPQKLHIQMRTPPLTGSVPVSEIHKRGSLLASDFSDMLSPIDGDEPT